MIQDIDKRLNSIFIDLQSYSDNVTFTEIDEFILGEGLGNICDTKHNMSGVYMFEIEVQDDHIDVPKWMETFTQDWTHTDVIWVPGTKKIRMSQHFKFKKWMPIYIGKSRNFGKRINEHLHQKAQAHTFGMKLMGRRNFYGRRFKVSWIPLNVTHYNMIAPTIEELLRNRYNPITGKQ